MDAENVSIVDETVILGECWKWLLAMGIVLLALGLAAISLPAVATFAIEVLLGWILILGGLAKLLDSIWKRALRGNVMNILSGLLFLVAGIVLLAYPLSGAITLTLFLAVFFVVEGIIKVILAFQQRPSGGTWVWELLSGILAVVLAFIIWSDLPFSSIWTIGILVGVYLLFTGGMMVALAMAARSAQSQ